MLDNTKQLHQIIDFVECQVAELLIEVVVVVLLDPKNKKQRTFFDEEIG
jgi:hypothetical protein